MDNKNNINKKLAMLALFAELNPGPLLRFDQQGVILFSNPAAKKIFGQQAKKDAKLSTFFPRLANIDWQQCINKNLSLTHEAQIDSKYFQFTIKCLSNLRVGHIYGNDITQRKKAGENLKKNEERLRQFFENSPVCAYMISPKGKIIDINNTALKMLGYKKEELIGQPVMKLYPVEIQTKAKKLFLEWKKGGNLENEELIKITKTGEQKTVLLSAGLVKNGQGKILHSISIERDITELKIAEEKLKESEELYRLTTENSLDGVYTIDASGKFLYVNQAFADIFGYSPKAILNFKDWTPLIPQKSTKKVQSYFTQLLSGKILQDEIVCRHKDGHKFLAAFKAVPLKKRGRITGITGVIDDITERRRSREALRRARDELAREVKERTKQAHELAKLAQKNKQADQAKDEFLATLAHELRNPLAPIVSTLELMKLQKTKDSEFVRTRDIIARQTKQLTKLLDDLMDVSRITRGLIRLEKKCIFLDQIIYHAQEAASPFIQAKKQKLSINLPVGRITLLADPLRLEQIVVNLLNNASKYTKPGGYIELKVENTKDRVLIKIKDSGKGIAPQMLPYIFDLFAATAQVSRADAYFPSGLGVGLKLVKQLVELHGGTVTALSQGKGQGSEFKVSLSNCQSKISAITQPKQKTTESLSNPKRRILIVDDNKDAAKSLGRLLQKLGHQVELAFDGPTAIACAATYLPDIIFLDIAMPGMSGWEVAQRLKIDYNNSFKLAALTGYGQKTDKQQAKNEGFDYYLVKPIGLAELRPVLNSLSN